MSVSPSQWEEAFLALATLVRLEYGDRYSLRYIAETWGEGIPSERLRALAVCEQALLGEAAHELVHDGGERVHVEMP
jgi:hypothetical protein